MQLEEYLSEQHVPFEIVVHPPAFTVRRLAYYLGVRDNQIARAELLHGPEGYFLAVLPGSFQVDLNILSCYLGGPVRIASTEEAARVFKDCEWGASSGFGNLYGLPTLLDWQLERGAVLIIEAGSHFESVRMSCEDFERLSGAFRYDFARPRSRR